MITFSPEYSNNVERTGSPGYFERQGFERTLFKRLFPLGRPPLSERNSSRTYMQHNNNNNKGKDVLNRVPFKDTSGQRQSLTKLESANNGVLHRSDSICMYIPIYMYVCA